MTRQKRSGGALFLIGGAAEKCICDFAALTGVEDPHVTIITHASAIPRQRGEQVSAQLRACGIKRITVLTPRSKQQALPEESDAIFITGGDQSRLVRLLAASGLGHQVREAYRRGVLVGGSSAGAACVPQLMVAGGMSDGVLRPDSLLLERGLCLLSGAIVDTHFGQRSRHNRLRAALAELAGVCGIGLDEDAAVLIENGKCRVFGAGHVWLFTHSRKPGDEWRNWQTRARHVDVRQFVAGESFALP